MSKKNYILVGLCLVFGFSCQAVKQVDLKVLSRESKRKEHLRAQREHTYSYVRRSVALCDRRNIAYVRSMFFYPKMVVHAGRELCVTKETFHFFTSKQINFNC